MRCVNWSSVIVDDSKVQIKKKKKKKCTLLWRTCHWTGFSILAMPIQQTAYKCDPHMHLRAFWSFTTSVLTPCLCMSLFLRLHEVKWNYGNKCFWEWNKFNPQHKWVKWEGRGGQCFLYSCSSGGLWKKENKHHCLRNSDLKKKKKLSNFTHKHKHVQRLMLRFTT